MVVKDAAFAEAYDELPFILGRMRHVDLLALLFLHEPSSNHLRDLTIARSHKGLLVEHVINAIRG